MATVILVIVILALIALTCAAALSVKSLQLVNSQMDLVKQMQLDYVNDRVYEEDYVQERALYAYCERQGDGSVKVILNTTSHSIIVCEYDSKDKALNVHCADDLCDDLNFAISEKMEGDVDDEDDDDLLEDDPEDDNDPEH